MRAFAQSEWPRRRWSQPDSLDAFFKNKTSTLQLFHCFWTRNLSFVRKTFAWLCIAAPLLPSAPIEAYTVILVLPPERVDLVTRDAVRTAQAWFMPVTHFNGGPHVVAPVTPVSNRGPFL